MRTKVQKTVDKFNKDKDRLVDILREVQSEFSFIGKEAIEIIADQLNLSEVDVEQTRSFYHFLTDKPEGKYAIYLNNSAVANMMGRADVAKAMEEAAGCKFGSTSEGEIIGLHDTACIGMNDQEPAAIINGTVFTNLSSAKATALIAGMKAGKSVNELHTDDMAVKNNLIQKGDVIFDKYESGSAIKKTTTLDPQAVINEMMTSNIRGRGGAGFPTGMKWNFCKMATGSDKVVICNADEGEPGTFKDRVILTEKSKQVFEGMAVGGYAIGAKEGILYLRAEYTYMEANLETALDELRKANVLGKNIGGKQGFDFDIRIQIGAGAYVCGEESALIESAEGKRGEPRNRPPFPAQKGYQQKPTIVNNVETFASVSKIMAKGGEWFSTLGTEESTGTKVLSISGDCKNPGVYEVEWGMTIQEMLDMVDAQNVQAVQVAGPSGTCISPEQFDRKIAMEDLATGGSMIVVGEKRDIIKDLVLNFMDFFADESCGSCTTCRGINLLLKQKIETIVAGKGIVKDIEEMESWGKIISKTTRCGLGQTSANPVLTTLKNFRSKYESLVKPDEYRSEFILEDAVDASCAFVDRKPNLNN